jgi:hypothetical protein
VRRTNRLAVMVACGVLVSLIGTLAGGALAHDRTYNRNISIQYKKKPPQFYGTIGSNNPECKDSQTVNLFENGVLVATTTSNNSGQYTFNYTAKPGARYFVRVDENVTGGYGHSHVCSGAQSRTIRPVGGASTATASSSSSSSSSDAGESIASLLLGGVLRVFSSIF